MTAVPPSLLKRLTSRARAPFFDQQILESDLRAVECFYQSEGFIDVRADVRTSRLKGGVSVTIEVQEGLPVTVAAISIKAAAEAENEGLAALFSRALTVLQTKPGSRFRDELLQQDRRRLADFFSDAGYPYARAEFQLQVERREHAVLVIWEVDLGPLCAFGPATVEGWKAASPDFNRLLAFRPGDPFKKKSLDASQQRLYALGLYDFVTVKALLPQPPQPLIPVEVMLREAPRTSVKGGIGYGREEELRVFVNLQRLRFLGGARRLNLQARRSALEPYSLEARAVQPAFLFPRMLLGFNPFLRSQTEPGYRLSRNGAALYLQHSVGTALNFGLTYTYEQVDLNLKSIAEPRATEALRGLYNKSSLLFGFSRNTADIPFSPTTGSRIDLTAKYSGLGAGEYHYVKWLTELRRYQRHGSAVTAVRLAAGRITSFDPSGAVPVEDLFFSGGANSVRAWGRHQLGPRDRDGKPIGGLALIEASLEERITLYRSLSGAFFCDAGNVGRTRLAPSDLRFALGCGLRFKTPIGPVRLDVARPVFEAEHGFRWHLTVGEAF